MHELPKVNFDYGEVVTLRQPLAPDLKKMSIRGTLVSGLGDRCIEYRCRKGDDREEWFEESELERYGQGE